MEILIISLENCSSAIQTVELVNDILEEMSLKVTPKLISIKTLDEAISYRHIGGPTVQINGLDIEPEARKIEQYGLC